MLRFPRQIVVLAMCVMPIGVALAADVKKGIGLVESEGLGEDQLNALHVG